MALGRAKARGAVLALVGATVIAVVVLQTDGDGRGTGIGRGDAERWLAARLTHGFPDEQDVNCVRTRRKAHQRVRYRCSWKAVHRLSPNRPRTCRGKHVIAYSHGWKKRRRSWRCVTRFEALAPRFGFNDNAIRAGQISPTADAALTERLGAGIHRLAVDWRVVEPERDHYELREYDRIYHAMLARGIRPLFILVFAPGWARDNTGCSGDCRYPPARRLYGEWGEFAALIARRYPRAVGIEIWNEPNLIQFWQPRPDPVRYAELLRVAHRAIKDANPRMRVISGGLSNLQVTNRTGLAGRDFLAAMYEAGARGHMDAVGFHPYPDPTSDGLVMRTLTDFRAVRDAAGDEDTPFWATETGVSTTGGLRSTPQDQADRLAKIYTLLSAQQDVGAVLIHTLLEVGGGVSGSERGFGIARGDGSPKPAFCALARATGARGACP
jgi:hypothetical protein